MVGLQLALTTHKAILCPKLACDSPPPLNLQDDNNEIIAITTPVPDSTYASHRIEIVVFLFFLFFFPLTKFTVPNFRLDRKETKSKLYQLLTKLVELINFATINIDIRREIFSNLK